MNPYNKIILIELLFEYYMISYEEKYQELLHKYQQIQSDNIEAKVKLFNEYENYIIDCITYLIETR